MKLPRHRIAQASGLLAFTELRLIQALHGCAGMSKSKLLDAKPASHGTTLHAHHDIARVI